MAGETVDDQAPLAPASAGAIATAAGRLGDLVRRRRALLGVLPFIALFTAFLAIPVYLIGRYAAELGPSGWGEVLERPGVTDALLRTVRFAAETTVLCVVLGYVYVTALVRAPRALRLVLFAALVVPLLTSTLVRTYSWVITLRANGPLAKGLEALPFLDEAPQILFTHTAMLIGMVHVLLPLFVLPLYAVMSRIPPELVRAARASGANRVQAFGLVNLPLSLPGALAGAAVVFITALGFFVTPALLGGDGDTVVAELIQRDLGRTSNINRAAALAMILTIAAVLLILCFRILYPLEALLVQKYGQRGTGRVARPVREAGRELAHVALRVVGGPLSRLPLRMLTLLGGIAIALFLVAPLLIVLPVSFSNDLILLFPPRTYGTTWYDAILGDPLWHSAAENTAIVGLMVLVIVSAVGLPLAFVIVRSRLRQGTKGTLVLLAMLPVIVPIVVLALGSFAWFIRIGWTGSLVTVAGSHALLAMPYFVLTVVAVLRDMDERIEMAARSVGASALQTLRHVTLPRLRPAIVSGLAVAFLISLDEFLIAQSVLSRAATTLPIRMWEGTQEQISPGLAVVAALSLVIASALTIVVVQARRLSSRIRDREARR